MADVLTRSQRSYCMSRVRDRNTAPEVRLRKLLWRAGMRYRLQSKLPGKPDMVFVRSGVAVFVDGCFWHRCPKHATLPKTNFAFWRQKLGANVKRDSVVNDQLRKLGWSVIRIWSHEIEQDAKKAATKVRSQITRNKARTGLLRRTSRDG